MITDALLLVSDAQAVTTTANSTDIIPLGSARDIGSGERLYMHFSINEDFAGGTDTTFEVVASDSTDLSNPVNIGSTGAIATSDLTEGSSFAVALSPQIDSIGTAYIGVVYTVSGTNTAGQVTASIVETVQDSQKYYASGFTVAS